MGLIGNIDIAVIVRFDHQDPDREGEEEACTETCQYKRPTQRFDVRRTDGDGDDARRSGNGEESLRDRQMLPQEPARPDVVRPSPHRAEPAGRAPGDETRDEGRDERSHAEIMPRRASGNRGGCSQPRFMRPAKFWKTQATDQKSTVTAGKRIVRSAASAPAFPP